MSDIFIKIKKQVLLMLKKVWIFLWFSDHRWETPPATVNAYYNPARNQISKPQAHFLFVIFIAYTLSTCYLQYVAVNYMCLHHSWTVSSFIHMILYENCFTNFFFLFLSVSCWNTTTTVLQERISAVSNLKMLVVSATLSNYCI